MVRSIAKLLACCLTGLALATSTLATSPPPPGYLQNTPSPALPAVTIAGLTHFLSYYQDAAHHPWPTLPDHKLLKMAMTSPLIAQLRQRLAATGDLTTTRSLQPDVFDAALYQAVQNFQQRMGLPTDGVVGPATLRELNVPPAVRAHQIAVNLKRWSDLAPQMGDHYVLVNVPDFQLFLYQDGKKILNMKAIVGKPTRQTPDIISSITHIVFNPYWNVPDMIANKDIIPKILDNPDYLNDMHIRVFASQQENAPQIAENSINWDQVADNGFPWHFRQDPGNDNALGRVKFEFQNSDSIYLHDTPTKSLFDQPIRLFSSGCIRLEKPLALVADLMQADHRWDESKMQTLLDKGKTVYVKTATPTPVIIAYLTAWVDDRGVLNFRDDVYGRDAEPRS